MIVYRQKLFWGAALKAGMNIGIAGLTAAGLIQGHNQGKEAEKQAEETKAAMDRQTKALNRIAREASKNPAVAQQVLAQKSFASASPILGFAKDLWKTQRGNVMKAGKMGLGFAGMGYAGNRIATSMKDHDTGNDKKNLSFLGKAAAVGTALGGTYMAAKRGMLPGISSKLTKDVVNQNVVRYMKSAGKALNPISRDANGSINKFGTGFNAFFIGSPILGYMGQRQQVKDQAKASEQKQYSDNEKKSSKALPILTGIGATGLALLGARGGYLGPAAQRTVGNIIAHTGGVLKSVGAKNLGNRIAGSGSMTYAKGFRGDNGMKLTGNDLLRKAAERRREVTGPAKISGAVNKIGSTFNFYGKGGTSHVQNTAKALAESNNKYSKGLGEWMQRHKTGANLLATAGTVGVGGAIMSGVQKPFEILDKHAYDMEKEQTQIVN